MVLLINLELETHQYCINDLREELVDCEGPADWFEKTNDTIVCQ